MPKAKPAPSSAAVEPLVREVIEQMLTKTVRQMEADGLVTRTVHPVIPPHVDYALTPLGGSLGEAFCGVWKWAEKNYARVEAARQEFTRKNPRGRSAAPKTPPTASAQPRRNR